MIRRLLSLLCLLSLLVPTAHGETRGALLKSLTRNAGPLHAEKHRIDAGQVEVGFFMWPVRSGQPALVSVQGALAPGRTVVRLVPTAGTDATPVTAVSQADAVMSDLSWHEVLLPVRGEWVLEAHDGTSTLRMPVAIAGPPEIPAWLGWLVGLSPLLGLAYFLRKLRTGVEDQEEPPPWWASNGQGGAG